MLDTLLTGRRALTSGLKTPDSWLSALFSEGETYSGKTVTPLTATQLVPVLSATTLLAGGVGTLPLIVYRRLERGRERAESHPAWRLCHDSPNSLMAADEYWELATAHLLLWGNHFSAKLRGVNGRVEELIPLRPDRVQVGVKNGRRLYVVDGRTNEPYDESNILHIRGLGLDGVVGLSPIQQARQALGNLAAREEFQGRFWANDARPGGVLKHPNELSAKALKRLKASWEDAHGGLANKAKTAILEEGMEWQEIGLPLADAQFVEQANLDRAEVALIFRVPPAMLAADVGNSLTYSTSETQSLDFVKWSLRRWLVRIERALLHDPDIFVQGTRFYPEFLIDGLLRADVRTRAQVYQAAHNRWLTTNEIRELENRNPLDGEEHDTINPAQAGPGITDEPEPGDDDDNPQEGQE
jgi:HK97 family phage portal protein